VIRSFADKATAKVWAGLPSRRLSMEVQNVARRKLRMLHNASKVGRP
jgi:proteic killer suppression protein